jgi:hypothetical protein
MFANRLAPAPICSAYAHSWVIGCALASAHYHTALEAGVTSRTAPSVIPLGHYGV